MSKICNKDYKFFKYNTDGIFATGRIKRIWGIPDNRWSRIFRRIGLKRYTLILNMNDDLFEKTMFGITRWNRH